LVICVDEKSQIQTLDRTQPLLPTCPGQVGRRMLDYERHGTTTLFARFIATAKTDVKTGTAVGRCMSRHDAQEFGTFLDEIESKVPVELDIHIVMNSASRHKQS
jgi:hypothetical protein